MKRIIRLVAVIFAITFLLWFFWPTEKGSTSVLRATGLTSSEVISQAKSGNATMQYNLALMYKAGESVDADMAQASNWMLRAAQQGLPQAQAKIGEWMWMGKGIPMNRKEGTFWLEKAAQQNNAEGQFVLGLTYRIVNGDEQAHMEKAFYWTLKAAEGGHPTAQYEVAYMYAWGRGTKQNNSQAVHWLHKSASNGYRPAMTALSDIYAKGLFGVKKDEVESAKWLDSSKHVN